MKLERVLDMSVYGVPVRMYGPPLLSRRLQQVLPHSTATSGEADPSLTYRAVHRAHGETSLGYEVWRADDSLVARSNRLENVVATLASELHFEIACRCTSHLFVHAGVVAMNGVAIVLPGRSMAGKSTLVAELVRQGCTYYSDEYAVMDDHGHVHPYARPLSMRDTSGHVRILEPSALTSKIGGPPLPVGLIAVLEYRQGQPWSIERLSPSTAALSIIDNTVAARDDVARTLSFAARTTTGLALRGGRGEATEAATALLDTLISNSTAATPLR